MALRRVPSSQSTLTLSPSKADANLKYGFHLLDSPLPSPALPSIIPRHGKKPNPHHLRKCLRVLLRLFAWACGLRLIYWLAWTTIWEATPPAAVSYLTVDGTVFNIAGDEALPQQPATVLVLDNRGRPKWTVSIPARLPFPLRPDEYATICHQSDQISKHLRESSSTSTSTSTHTNTHQTERLYDYYYHDSNFMDVAEAEQHGLLPSARGVDEELKKRTVSHVEGRDDSGKDLQLVTGSEGEVCGKSLTYILESTDAGFGKTLLGLWISYGLAKKEGRAFFIDDTNWYFSLLDACISFFFCFLLRLT